MRRNNVAEMTITEQIVKIKEDACEYACKYREFYRDKFPSDDVSFLASLQGYCHGCPLGRLYCGK